MRKLTGSKQVINMIDGLVPKSLIEKSPRKKYIFMPFTDTHKQRFMIFRALFEISFKNLSVFLFYSLYTPLRLLYNPRGKVNE